MQNCSPHNHTILLNIMWKQTLPPKVKMFAWLLIRNRLQVRSRLNKFIPSINPESALCGNHAETVSHLFLHCPFAQTIWSCVGGSLPPIYCREDLITWLSSLHVASDTVTPNDLCKALYICSQICDSRNNLILLGSSTLHGASIWIIGVLTSKPEFVKKLSLTSNGTHLYGWVKINFDGTVRNHQAAICFVIKNDDTHVQLAGAKRIGNVSITVAEGLAFRDGLAYAVSKGWRRVVVEGDSKLVIDSVNNQCSVPWCLSQISKDVEVLKSFCEEVQFVHVFLEANTIADALAAPGHSLSPSQLWDGCLPLSIVNAF